MSTIHQACEKLTQFKENRKPRIGTLFPNIFPSSAGKDMGDLASEVIVPSRTFLQKSLGIYKLDNDAEMLMFPKWFSFPSSSQYKERKGEQFQGEEEDQRGAAPLRDSSASRSSPHVPWRQRIRLQLSAYTKGRSIVHYHFRRDIVSCPFV